MLTLLRDALDRTLDEPQCASRWHALMTAWLETQDDAARRSALAALDALPLSDVRADVLRLTFLAGASGDARYEAAAAECALAVQPADADRLAALLAYRWLNTLQESGQRSGFVAALAAAHAPEMAARLAGAALQCLPPEFAPRVPGAIGRVAMIVPQVANRFHTPSALAMAQCGVLAREGIAVHMFAAQELTPPDAMLFRGDGLRLALPSPDAKALAAMLPAGVGLTVGDTRFGLRGRWRKLMAPLAEFDPDAIFLVGLYSPLAAALHAVRPVLGLSVNSVPPLAPLDAWLSPDPQPALGAAWAAVFPQPHAIFHSYRVRRSAQQWPLGRRELGLAENAVVWVTTGFRLGYEIRGEWAGAMLRQLERHPEATWLLVGGNGELPAALRSAPPGRVRALPTRDDVIGIVRNCDIYVNPPRMGGGFSVVEAMAEGLPVTAFPDSDGGDKVGELALPDLAAYMERLAALTQDPALRRRVGDSLRRRFAERYDLDASGPALRAALGQAAALAGERFTPAS